MQRLIWQLRKLLPLRWLLSRSRWLPFWLKQRLPGRALLVGVLRLNQEQMLSPLLLFVQLLQVRLMKFGGLLVELLSRFDALQFDVLLVDVLLVDVLLVDVLLVDLLPIDAPLVDVLLVDVLLFSALLIPAIRCRQLQFRHVRELQRP